MSPGLPCFSTSYHKHHPDELITMRENDRLTQVCEPVQWARAHLQTRVQRQSDGGVLREGAVGRRHQNKVSLAGSPLHLLEDPLKGVWRAGESRRWISSVEIFKNEETEI